jgi:hypothetical protein
MDNENDALVLSLIAAAAGRAIREGDKTFHDELMASRTAVSALISAVEQDAVDKAVAAGLGVSEWRALLSDRESEALARLKGDA